MSAATTPHGPGEFPLQPIEVVSVLAALGLVATHVVVFARVPGLWHWTTPLLVLLGLLGADLVSGVLHWAGDTWGDEDTPVVGRRSSSYRSRGLTSTHCRANSENPEYARSSRSIGGYGGENSFFRLEDVLLAWWTITGVAPTSRHMLAICSSSGPIWNMFSALTSDRPPTRDR